MKILRPFKTIKGIFAQLIKMSEKAADASSFLRFAMDICLLPVMRLFRLSLSDRERQIRLRGGVRLIYRLNRGDIQSIREVWLDEVYKLPFIPKSNVLIDLGANIGLTSVWLVKHYGYSTIILIEPSPSNVRLTRLNLENNHIPADVVEAAIGPVDNTVFFEDDLESNLGRVGSKGRPVQMLSMQSVLNKLPAGALIDLVKIDIEGGEEALLQGDLTWLQSVRSIIAEFHPLVVDYPRAIKIIEDRGFRYIAAGTAHKNSMDAFVRETLMNTNGSIKAFLGLASPRFLLMTQKQLATRWILFLTLIFF